MSSFKLLNIIQEALTGWFSVYWAAKIDKELEKDAHFASEKIAVAWCTFEAEGKVMIYIIQTKRGTIIIHGRAEDGSDSRFVKNEKIVILI